MGPLMLTSIWSIYEAYGDDTAPLDMANSTRCVPAAAPQDKAKVLEAFQRLSSALL
jgi:hypothetical protein